MTETPPFSEAEDTNAMVRFWIGIANYCGIDPAILSAGGVTIQSVGQDENARITWQGQSFISLADLQAIADEAGVTPVPYTPDTDSDAP